MEERIGGIGMKVISRNITTCPYCHNRLNDEVREGTEVKACYSDICMVQCGDKGRVWESAEYGDIWD